MKSINLTIIITFIMLFIRHNSLSAGERLTDLNKSKTLLQQTAKAAALKILDFYQKDASIAFAQTEKYLKNVPWDAQRKIFYTLVQSLPAIPAYYVID